MDYEFQKKRKGKDKSKDNFKFNGGNTTKHIRVQEKIKELNGVRRDGAQK